MQDDHPEWLYRLAEESGADLLRFLGARLADRRDAEDLAQEVYLRLLRLDKSARIHNHRAYALRVAANVAHEWRLLARNRLSHSSEALDHLVDPADPPREALLEQQMRQLEAALGTLSPKCRAVVIMHRRDRYTCKEIARRMGISVGMVRKYLARGVATCQEALSCDDRVPERRLNARG